MIRMKSLKRSFIPLIGMVFASGAQVAHATTAGICTSVTVGTAAATVLAANTSSYPRRYLEIQMGTNTTNGVAPFAWCTVGGTAANNVGRMLFGAAAFNTGAGNVTPPNVWVLPAVQQPSNSFPQVPNGAVSCIANAASQTITACAY